MFWMVGVALMKQCQPMLYIDPTQLVNQFRFNPFQLKEPSVSSPTHHSPSPEQAWWTQVRLTDSGIPFGFQFPLLDHLISHPLSFLPPDSLLVPSLFHMHITKPCNSNMGGRKSSYFPTADSPQTIVHHSSIQVLSLLSCQVFILQGGCIASELSRQTGGNNVIIRCLVGIINNGFMVQIFRCDELHVLFSILTFICTQSFHLESMFSVYCADMGR